MERTEQAMQARVALPASPTSPAEARRFAAAVADGWGFTSAELALVVGELTTNAVVHAECGFALTLTRAEDAIRVEVSDAARQLLPVPRPLAADGAGGRGLRIVDELSLSWGVTNSGAVGKTVWADVPVGFGGQAAAGPPNLVV